MQALLSHPRVHEVDEAAARRHPYRPEVPHSGSAVLADGTVVDW
jgi:galactonate dehydratase